MATEQQKLEALISGLEAQRALLGDALVDASLLPLRARLAACAQLPSTLPSQSLKQVSILFLDVVGSTLLAQRLDPEDIHSVMDGALARCTEIVVAHQGKVLQYAGDSVLAVFGADDVREDDAARSVHAGLALLEEGRRQGEWVAQRHGHAGLHVRVGIHTGGVLLGGGVDSDGSIRGMAVNIAARMEQSAPAGALRISHDTYVQVRGVFDVQAQPPLAVKGVAEPILTYLVERARPRAFRLANRGIEGVQARMVGRDAELELLRHAFKRLFLADAGLAVVTVVAEAGLGKSRLLHEFQTWTQARAGASHLFQGRASPQTLYQPYGLLREVLAWWLQIADSDSMGQAKQKIEQGIVPLFEHDDGADMAQAHAHVLGHLIGLDFHDSKHVRGILDDSRQIRNRAFHVAAQLLRRIAALDGAPVLLLLDDLHWADEGTLGFLDYLAQVNRDLPTLVLALARPVLFERRTDWSSGTGMHQRIDLTALDMGASRELANELLNKLAEIPAALRDLITGGAEGNPFYMEELVKMLVDEGAITIGTDGWSLRADRLLATHVPQTLTGVLQARLDGLQPAHKLALQQASVIGLVFWDQALAAIDAQATQALPALVQRELAVAHLAANPDLGVQNLREYAFKHQILHQVTYETVLKSLRREAHAKVADWMARMTGARAGDFIGATAEHYEQAGDTLQAAEFFVRAAEHARERHAHDEVLVYVARALALLGDEPGSEQLELRWRLLDVRERALDLQGKRTEQRADIDRLQVLADLMDDDVKRGYVALRRSSAAGRTGDTRTMESAARQAMALTARAGGVQIGLRAQQRLALALSRRGKDAQARLLAEEGLATARLHGLRAVEQLFVHALPMIVARQNEMGAPLEMFQQDLLLCRELGDRLAEASALCNLGAAWLDLGAHDNARPLLEDGLRLTRALGNRAAEPIVLINLSALALRLGEDSQALAHAQAALDIAVAVENLRAEVFALCCLGNAELALGRFNDGKRAFKRANDLGLTIDEMQRFDAAAGLARAALMQGECTAASETLEGLLAHLRAGGGLHGMNSPALVRLTCYQALVGIGDPSAGDMLASAHRELQARAATIADAALRHSFLNSIPEHREIVACWSHSQTGP